MHLRHLPQRLFSKIDLHRGAERLIAKPQVVDLVLTKACNLACTFCKDYEIEGAKNVTESQLRRVAEQLFPGASRLSICSGGEPYLHRGLEFILREAKRYKLYTWVLSNGMLMKEERLRAILEEDLISEHGFSVDGIEPATVEAIRVFAKLPVILENVRMLMRLRGQLGKRNPAVTIRYALMRSNVEELPAAIRYWGEEGANRVDCGYLSLANGLPREQSLYFHQELMADVFAKARETAARYPNLQVNLPNLIRDEEIFKREPKNCTAPWTFVMIDASGAILPCYRAFEGISMGNLYEDDTPFSEVWNSPLYQGLRRTVNDDGSPKAYKYCSVCEYRYGWSELRSHLGDETWMEMLREQQGEAPLVQIDHRRLKR
jgi:radical SAM protein with 4Fe4S-binding SPASM domain